MEVHLGSKRPGQSRLRGGGGLGVGGRQHKVLEEALGLEAIWTVLETPEDRLPF